MTEAVGTGHACFLCFLPTASASSPHTAWHYPFPTTVFYQHTHPPPLQRNLFHLYKFLLPHSKKGGEDRESRKHRENSNKIQKTDWGDITQKTEIINFFPCS